MYYLGYFENLNVFFKSYATFTSVFVSCFVYIRGHSKILSLEGVAKQKYNFQDSLILSGMMGRTDGVKKFEC